MKNLANFIILMKFALCWRLTEVIKSLACQRDSCAHLNTNTTAIPAGQILTVKISDLLASAVCECQRVEPPEQIPIIVLHSN